MKITRSVSARLKLKRRREIQRLIAVPLSYDLDRLARLFHTDKANAEHGYSRLYKRHLPARKTVRKVLEIGIGGTESTHGYETLDGGASLRMWQAYFRGATVVGVDIYPKSVTGPRIVVEQGSQDDPDFLAMIVRRHGPFDVIIDDGSHIGRHQVITLAHTFRALRPGGVYAIEDLDTAYRANWEGGPPGTAETSVDLLKGTVDDVLRRHWDLHLTALPVDEVHVYDQIAFLVRGRG